MNSIHNSGNCLPHASVIHLFSPSLYLLLSFSLYPSLRSLVETPLLFSHFISFSSHTHLLPVFLLIFFYPSLEIKSTFQSGCSDISAHFSSSNLNPVVPPLHSSRLFVPHPISPPCSLSFPLSLHPSIPASLMIILIASSSRSTASAFPSDAVYLISVPQGISHMEQPPL